MTLVEITAWLLWFFLAGCSTGLGLLAGVALWKAIVSPEVRKAMFR